MKISPSLFKPLVLGLLLVWAGGAAAHGGRLDSKGCHHDRKNGGYHCHRSSGSTPTTASKPVASIRRTPSPQVPQIYYPSQVPSPQPDHERPVENPPTEAARFFFSTCSQARSIGKRDLKTVADGYRSELDSNGNGVACDNGDD